MFAITSPERSWKPPSSINCRNGLVREEPRFVPPSRSHRRTVSRFKGKTSGSGFNKLLQPSNRPKTSRPSSEPRYTRPLIAGFNPGASPPPVSTPTRIIVSLRLTTSDGLEIRIECQMRGAEQARVVATFTWHNLHFLSGHRKSTFGDLTVHVLFKQLPRTHDSTANYNHFRIQNVD